MLAEGFRGPEKARGTFGFASSQGKRGVASQDIRQNPAITQVAGDLRPVGQGTLGACVVLLCNGDQGDAPRG